jgi:hypothetical protein
MREDGTFATPELDDMFPFLEAEELATVRQEAASCHVDSAGQAWGQD